ncbi:DUF262 domain-containing protein [Macrococcoides goetzii]|uniref:DUF262 domain-containing protein n=1 Tax=Macrococcoides goetzii TaxID=1891097 RepID=A0A2G5NVM1_9STAP|nr:DUF262 domain-containing protein [Macrococcus goetzii]RAI79384.1 DUF262 domain-containing protein [Macrococcus goetzii]
MKFHPEDKKIKEILSSAQTYQIPNFQRDYSWENKNFEHFLDDLLTVSKANFDNGLMINSEDQMEDYFFGTILVVGDYSSERESRIVIDGQQRLTTMTLFLAAIRDLIEKEKSNYHLEYDHNFNEALMSNKPIKGKYIQKARVINEKLEPILPVNILNINQHKENGVKHEAKNESQNYILEKYNWFLEELSIENISKRLKGSKLNKAEINLLNTYKGFKYINFLDNLGTQLLNSTVIIIYSEDEESANVMYRNFNYRGLPLSGPDLIKNEIFELLDDSTSSVKENWKAIEANVSEKNAPGLTTFFIHYFSSMYKSIPKHQVFNEFINRIDSNIISYSTFINDLLRESEHYRIMINPDDNDKLFSEKNYFSKNVNKELKRNLILLNEFDVTQVRSLLLGLFDARLNEKISSKQFKNVISKLVQYQSLFILVSASSNKIRSIYFKYGKKFRNMDKAEADSVIEELYSELRKKLPSKEVVINNSNINYQSKNVSKMNSKEQKDWRLIKLILSTISKKVQKDSGNINQNGAFNFIDDATLEHIIDQSTSINNRYSIGNIILLEAQYHENDGDKEKMYDKSHIDATKAFIEKLKTFKDEEAIDKRREELISEYYDIVIR